VREKYSSLIQGLEITDPFPPHPNPLPLGEGEKDKKT